MVDSIASAPSITPPDRDAIIQALRAGVVPKVGLRHIQVGRTHELEALAGDIERIRLGGASLRFIIGEYGTGKTLFLNLVRLIALERNLVVVSADLGPSRRAHASGGEAQLLFNELVSGLGTRWMPEGGALARVVERFMAETLVEARRANVSLDQFLRQRLAPLHELVFGFDFAAVLIRYGRACEVRDESGKMAALRWLRAEYGTRSEARAVLGVREIINDVRVYDCLKLLARFVTLAGYDGLLVVLDEMVNLYKLTSAQARNANYEQLLRIANDVLQGHASYIGLLMGGTPEFLMDARRGLYSDPALQSRLAQNRFARDGLTDWSGPVIRLERLAPEHLFVLLKKIRDVFAWGDPVRHVLPDRAVARFLEHCSNTLGDAHIQTPRHTVTEFVNLLSVLEQNPSIHWQDLIGDPKVDSAWGKAVVGTKAAAAENEHATFSQDEELASFRL